jgi:hypothetical protein
MQLRCDDPSGKWPHISLIQVLPTVSTANLNSSLFLLLIAKQEESDEPIQNPADCCESRQQAGVALCRRAPAR